MGRPSKLTDKQWSEITKRVVSGEKVRPIAREYGVTEAAIRQRVSSQCAEIKSVAEQLVASDDALRSLPVTSQILALNLADELRATSAHLASAAKYGAMTAHRLAGIAHRQTDQIDEAASLEENMLALKSVAAFTATANEAAKTGLNLIAASKGRDLIPEDGGPANVQRIERVIIDVTD